MLPDAEACRRFEWPALSSVDSTPQDSEALNKMNELLWYDSGIVPRSELVCPWESVPEMQSIKGTFVVDKAVQPVQPVNILP